MNEVSTLLETHGVAVVPGFLGGDLVARVQKEMQDLRDRDEFKRASIGRTEGKRLEDEIRRDWTKWFEPTHLSAVQSEIVARLDELKAELNRALFLGLWDFEGHYAIYPPGAFYKTHLDRFKNDSKRTVSIVLFFNDDWRLERDGGGLRLELEPSRVVSPDAGTLVCFLSQQVPHEVLETHRERMSFAGWFKTRA